MQTENSTVRFVSFGQHRIARRIREGGRAAREVKGPSRRWTQFAARSEPASGVAVLGVSAQLGLFPTFTTNQREPRWKQADSVSRLSPQLARICDMRAFAGGPDSVISAPSQRTSVSPYFRSP